MNHELGITFRSEPQTPDVISDVARQYGLEVDMLGVYDDLGDLSPMPPLIAAAKALSCHAETRVGPVGFAVPKYTSMVDVIGSMATLEAIRPGHVFLGLVPGAWMESLGLKSATVTQVQEAIESSRYLLEKKVDGYKGKYYQVEPGFVLNYETPAELPFLLGAYGPKLAALAGEVAQEIKIGGSSNPAMISIVRERVRVGTHRAGRQINEVGIVLGAVTVVDEDRDEALRIARRKALIYINVVGDKDPTVIRDFPEEILAIRAAMATGDADRALGYLPEALAKRFIFAGNPSDIILQIEEVFAAGARRVEFGTPHGTVDELVGVKLLVEKVFPHFRNR